MTVSMSSATTSVAMTVALVEGKTHAENETIGAVYPSRNYMYKSFYRVLLLTYKILTMTPMPLVMSMTLASISNSLLMHLRTAM